jgi:hypothetical protein
MPRQSLAILAVLVFPTTTLAASGDYLLLHGTVVDRGSAVVVLNGDDGKRYYVTAGSGDQSTVSGLRAGATISVRGVEGAYPNEVKADGVDPDSRRAAWRLPSASAGSALSAAMLSYKDWRLPAGNRYEAYNTASASYTPVDASSVLGRLDAGELIFDRTREQWVQHPSVGGRNRAYLEGGAVEAGGTHVHGDWRLPRGNRYETYDPGSATYRAVDFASLGGRLDRGELIYDRTAGKWVQHPSVGADSTYRSAQVRGRVQGVAGHSVVVTGDDGKTITVDASKLKPEVVRALRWSQPVEVRGSFDAARTRLTASDLDAGK